MGRPQTPKTPLVAMLPPPDSRANSIGSLVKTGDSDRTFEMLPHVALYAYTGDVGK